MTFQSKMTSQGRVTVPVEIRRKLGLRRGDNVEFRERAGETVIARAPHSSNAFVKYAGILRKKGTCPFDSRKWLACLREGTS